jgi:hypothetical protein
MVATLHRRTSFAICSSPAKSSSIPTAAPRLLAPTVKKKKKRTRYLLGTAGRWGALEGDDLFRARGQQA